MTEPSAPEDQPKSDRVFLGASRPPKPPSEMTEVELDAWAGEVVRAMFERIEQAKSEDSQGECA